MTNILGDLVPDEVERRPYWQPWLAGFGAGIWAAVTAFLIMSL